MNLMSIFKPMKKLGDEAKTNEQEEVHAPSFADRMKNMKEIGFYPKCIYDCGASVGYWSYEISAMFPGSQILAIEPNSLVIPQTKNTLASVQPKVIIEQCALGAETGEAVLNIWDNDQTKMSGSSLKEHVQGQPKNKLTVKLKTLDKLTKQHQLRPDLVKFDLQGGEQEALKGSSQVLTMAEVVIVEFGCLPAYIERTTPLDLMKIFYENDYCLYDIIDLIYRPYDNALTGGDFIFVKNNSALKSYKGYK